MIDPERVTADRLNIFNALMSQLWPDNLMPVVAEGNTMWVTLLPAQIIATSQLARIEAALACLLEVTTHAYGTRLVAQYWT